jgi:hypothetical protein
MRWTPVVEAPCFGCPKILACGLQGLEQFSAITETREGIAGSTIEAREEQTHWCHDLSCMPAPPALHTVRISLPMQPENPRLLLMQSIGSNTQVCLHGAIEQECCTDSIPLDLPSPAEHTITFPSLKPHGLRAVPINAKDGKVPTTETREGIDGSEVIAGSEIREGPSQHLCHCNSCSTCQSEQPH